jgi:N-acetylglucosaminyl-diphospho-decaprenol L-rhamnosyltransferase
LGIAEGRNTSREVRQITESSPDLAVVTVSFNTRQLLAECLDSVMVGLGRSGLRGELWVVDNASADASAEMVRDQYPTVHLIPHQANVGFAAANNLALRAMGLGEQAHPRHVLFLNPDTCVVDDALGQMVGFLDATPCAGVAGARLVHGDGRLQHSAFRFPGLMQILLDFYPVHHRLLDSCVNGRYSGRLYQRNRPFEVDFVLGAALMVRAEALVALSGFDEQFFMYLLCAVSFDRPSGSPEHAAVP